MKVLKFGGTSVESAERIHAVAEICISTVKSSHPICVVVSALSGITNGLVQAAQLAAAGDKDFRSRHRVLLERHRTAIRELFDSHKAASALGQIDALGAELLKVLEGVYLVRESSPRTLDQIMSFGERMSAVIISAELVCLGIDAEVLDARTVVRTNSQFGTALVDENTTHIEIARYFREHRAIQVVTGFIGSNDRGETTTLGRGGSDYTAAIFAAALKAEELQIWTDVDGVMTADPRKVKKAFPISHMSYNEALELCHFGAKVIYPPTLAPVLDANIPLKVLNTMAPNAPGTLIGGKAISRDHSVTGISSISEVALVRLDGCGMIGVAGIARRVFGALAERNVNVILISQASSEHSICFAVEPQAGELACEALESEFKLEIAARQIDQVTSEREHSILAVIGENMRHRPGIAGRLFGALGKNGVNVVAISQGSSELNISVVIPAREEAKALNALHDAFFLSGEKSVHLFLAGPGSVGGALLKQIESHREILKKERALDLKLAGVINRKGYVVSTDRLDFSSWDQGGSSGAKKAGLDKFVSEMIDLNLSNAVFVDCTADEEVATRYERILQASISIVTPNKKANAGTYARFTRLRELARKHNVTFGYETNVGAGLPVLSTLHDLVLSGDRVEKIEAVLSGTLSYIFNTFSTEESFSSIVRKAMEKGLTEPDPRDDLSGRDVARKLLILAREIGLPLEEKDVNVENLVPQSLASETKISKFLNRLTELDEPFDLLRRQAEESGQRLRYIGSVDPSGPLKEAARVSLESVGPEHPFYSLSGSDNIVSFTTMRYKERPLVIKGPGAGTEVTAAGVFSDIVRAASLLA